MTATVTTIAIQRAFCTTREAAKLLGVSIGTVQQWVESGVLEAWKTAGGHRRVMRDSVDRLLHKSPTAVPEAPLATQGVTATRPGLGVMVVEDNPILRHLYSERLRQWPVVRELVVHDNAFSALMSIERARPDLLITDLSMPGMDGREMLRVLSKSPQMEHTTIVVVSGLEPLDIAAGGGVPAGIEVLPKPIPFERLKTIATDLWLQKSAAALGG